MTNFECAGLNEAQLAAVTAKPGNMLILAGAGSGKTKVLVNRIAWLLKNQHANPAQILAVTFTNKAANEMRNRLQQMLNMPLANMWVGTFHGIAHRLLRIHWQDLNLSQDFQILDADEQLKLIKQAHKELNLSEEKWPPRRSQWFINTSKDEGLRSESVPFTGNHINDKLVEVYKIYTKLCRQNGLVDFADLLLYSYELWRDHTKWLEQYQQRFQHVLIDEFQDTNSMQYAWLKLLRQSNFTIVGDDDQSIYGWRGAKIENIQSLTFDLPDMEVVRLEQNYRSTSNILNAANAVIANNLQRLGKTLWTSAKEGELINLYAASNEIDEARFVVQKIVEHLRKGGKPQDIAILYRSNAQSRLFEEKLIQNGIPYQMYGNLKFAERAEIKDALAYLRLLINPHDDSAFMRIVNVPTRGIGETTLAKLHNYAVEHNFSLWSAMKNMLTKDEFTPRATQALASFTKLIEFIDESVNDESLDRQIEFILLHTGLYSHYKAEKSEKGQIRIENLDELVNTARRFDPESEVEGSKASIFLSQLALENVEEASVGDKGVQLMTLHAAKGLEFPIVFLVGLEQGLFPHQLALNEDGGIEEERRLCYVGMTRAMQELYLTYAYVRRLHGRENYRMCSDFIREIPPELLELKR